MSTQKKEIKIENGNVKDLNISPVYEHIKTNITQKAKNNKKIVIPKGKK